MTKLVFIIGAGATYGDSMASSESKRPPLDRRFFLNAKVGHRGATDRIARFFQKHLQYDIYAEGHDRLEGIMSMLYSDIYHPQIGAEAFDVFRSLIMLYNRRIAETTNSMKTNNRRFLFKLIANHLSDIEKISDITFITFNQDVHLEKTLHQFSRYKKYEKYSGMLNYPAGYKLKSPTLTHPTAANIERFPTADETEEHPKLLKLHGSLNWYSTHNTPNLSQRQIFNPKRKIHIIDQIRIGTNFKLVKEKRSVDTFPIIIPPVVHKSSVLHSELKPLWTDAEQALRSAKDIVVCGYSCPESDVESANMIRRGITNNSDLLSLSVIDPNPQVVHRYLDLLELGFIAYYQSVNYYLTKS